MKKRIITIEYLGKAFHEFVQRHWQTAMRLRGKLLLSEEAFHLILAGAVGIIGGGANLLFYLTNETLKTLFLRQPGDPAEIAHALAWWQRIMIPAIGGIGAGLVLCWGFRLVKLKGSTNIMEAVHAGDGRLSLRDGIIRAMSSLISISTGASIGREGLITQLSATVASQCGQWAKWQPYRLRLLVACGAASGMSAAYNAPIAGAVFAAHIVLGNFSMHLFAPLVFSAVIATMVSRSFFGIEPWYQVSSFDFTNLGQLPWFLPLGLLAGIAGAAFLKTLVFSQRKFELWIPQLWGRLAIAGLIVGIIAVIHPDVWGNGYTATHRILYETVPQSLTYLCGLLLAKVAATVITVGAGTVGGLFTPTLFVGATLGSVYGAILHDFKFAIPLPISAFALVGMGSVLASTIHSPLIAMIVVFELSLNYSIMPPLMLACVLSTLLAKRLHPVSVYTEPLQQKGVLGDHEDVAASNKLTVGDLMREPAPPLLATATFREVVNSFLDHSNNFLPVIDAQQTLVGVVALQDMKSYLNTDTDISGIIAYDLMRPPPPCLTPQQGLGDVLPLLLSSELRYIPVVNSLEQKRLIGSLFRSEALGLLSEAIAQRTSVRT